MKKRIATIAMAMLAMAALAQYAIKWSTIDGGGGTASGGSFVLRGTIGQPDAANSAGGDFAMQGGFWVPVAVQVAGAPWLNIVSVGGTTVVVSWTPDTPGWILQETSILPTNWVNSASGITNPVSIPTTEAAKFYRLKKQ